MALFVRYQPIILGGGGGGGVSIIGPIDSVSPSANGAVISGPDLIMQSASVSVPGLVNNTTQGFNGDKTFNNKLIVQSQANGTPALEILGVSGATHPTFFMTARDSNFLVFDNTASTAIAMAISYTGQVGIGTTPNGSAQLDIRAYANEYGLQLFNPSSLPQDFLRMYDGSNALMVNVTATGGAVFSDQVSAPTILATTTGDSIHPGIAIKDGSNYFGLGMAAGQVGLMGEGGFLFISFNPGNAHAEIEGSLSVDNAFHANDPTDTSIYLGNDGSTGIYRPGANEMAFSGSGSKVMGITSAGLTMSKVINMNTHLINNVVDPVSAQDAATKNYVDTTAITALTGDATATGPGSAALTLATVNGNVGSFTYASITVNAKGLITAAASGSAPLTNPMTTLGDLIYEDATPVAVRLAGNTTTTKKFLTQTGNGSISAAPGWNVLVAGDVPSLAASIITSGTLATARGGTNLDTSASTGVAKVSSGTWSVAAVTGSDFANQSAQTYFGGPTSGSASPSFKAFVAPTVQKFAVTGTTTGYLFTISTSSTVAVGDTYTNNGFTYTVLGALTAQTGAVLFCSQASAPQASGNLIRATGAGTATIAFTSSSALATYTAATNPAPMYIRVRAVGGGAGGGGGGSGSPGTGAAGGNTVFGASMLALNGGAANGNNSSGGAGGTASLGSGPIGSAFPGGSGSGGTTATGALSAGGRGTGTPFGGGGGGADTASAAAGFTAPTNTGGGGGGGSASTAAGFSGAGGAAGGYVDAVISSPAATYPYAVGIAGTAGAAGTLGTAGGAGAAGYIEVTEYYQ